MKKEFHVWFNKNYPAGTLITYPEVIDALMCEEEVIHTVQTRFIHIAIFVEQGYKLIIHPLKGEPFELNLIKNNLETRLLNGEFNEEFGEIF